MAVTAETFGCTGHTTLPIQDRSGRSSCYNCIIEDFQAQSYNLARRMLSDWVHAEDAVQDSFLSGYRAFHQFRGDNLQAWLMRIVANTCRDMLRVRRSRPTVPLDPLPVSTEEQDPIPTVANLRSTLESPEEYAERGELNRAIHAGLDSLPEERRLAVLLAHISHMTEYPSE